jgi:hypothetical protein
MTAQLSLGQRRPTWCLKLHIHNRRGVPGSSIYEMGDEFPCGLLGFHIGILANGAETSRMDLYDRRFTLGARRVPLWSSYDGWITRNTSHSIRGTN